MATGHEEFLSDLNQKVQAPQRALVLLILTVMITVSILFIHFAIGARTVLLMALAVVIGVSGAIWTARAIRDDRERRTLQLDYQLDAGAQQAFNYLIQAFESLTAAGGFWHIPTAEFLTDRKYSGGATLSVTRERIVPTFVCTDWSNK